MIKWENHWSGRSQIAYQNAMSAVVFRAAVVKDGGRVVKVNGKLVGIR